jgi:hypothetical protein
LSQKTKNSLKYLLKMGSVPSTAGKKNWVGSPRVCHSPVHSKSSPCFSHTRTFVVMCLTSRSPLRSPPASYGTAFSSSLQCGYPFPLPFTEGSNFPREGPVAATVRAQSRAQLPSAHPPLMARFCNRPGVSRLLGAEETTRHLSCDCDMKCP